MANSPSLTAAALLSIASAAVAQDPPQPALDPEHLAALSRKCGTEIDWHSAWPEAQSAAREQGRPVMVLVRKLAGFDVPDGAMLGPFMDLDIIELVGERYVALRYSPGEPAPFASQDSYGMGPFTFGTSVLVVDQDGDVVGDTFTLESTTLYEFLARQAEPYRRPSPGGLSSLGKARWHLRRGELDRAAAILGHEGGPSAHRLRATLLRRQRRAAPALEALQRAEESGAAAVDLALERSLLLMRLDRHDEARDQLALIPEHHRDRAAAVSYRGSLNFGLRRIPAARADVTELLTSHPDSRWSWLAAALVLAGVMDRDLGEPGSFAWPTDQIVATLKRHPHEVSSPTALDRIERDAFELLLAGQREDGSWVVPIQVMDTSDHRRNPLVVGVTVLAARALLPHLADDRATAAIERTASFLKEVRQEMKAKGERFAAMDYTVWSKPSQLLFLADAIEHGALDEDEWFPAMQELVGEMEAKQKAGGGWNYYMGNSLDALDPQLNISFSFVTAYVMQALLVAQELGVEVPEEVVAKGLDCLARCKNPDDSFEYSLVHAAEDAPRTMTPSGSAGRGPLCALTLYLWGEADLDLVETALERFVEHRGTYAREHGKTLMHCGLEGEGSHYLMFDYAFAAAATAQLSGEVRDRFQAEVLDQVLGARTTAGSFVDNPMIGEPYGTAMALWTIHRLKTREP